MAKYEVGASFVFLPENKQLKRGNVVTEAQLKELSNDGHDVERWKSDGTLTVMRGTEDESVSADVPSGALGQGTDPVPAATTPGTVEAVMEADKEAGVEHPEGSLAPVQPAGAATPAGNNRNNRNNR